MPEAYNYEEVQAVADFLFNKTEYRPMIGIICGSGLAALGSSLEEPFIIDYEKIPNFPTVSVQGHVGRLVFGKLKGKIVVCLQGRFHYYEGYSMQKVTFPVRVLAALKIKTLIVTNAAGGINLNFNVGDIMIIKDHISFPMLSGNHPLYGRNDDRFGTRFPSMSNAYTKELRELALKKAKELQYDDFIRTGVYCNVSGPHFETPAEISMLRVLGADSVGMSTAPEVVVAVHEGLQVLGISLITNKCVSDVDSTDTPNHEEVLETGKKRAANVQAIVESVVEAIE